ncbi:hypothetical protein KAW65_02835 [candidate division WOR-3 bacterium]|nr:hypothetical protein [candidate division WOR-3 bacterium]
MSALIGIRREDKNKWERRVPLTPEHIKELKEKYSIETLLQTSRIRIFKDNDYIKAGARVNENLSECPIIFALKEIPLHFLEPKKTYVFFSHTIKGQSYNMPMLKKLLDLKCQLIDYEKIADENGIRLLFFGRHAGYAGMIDSLWALGQRLNWEGITNPFSKIKQAHKYKNLEEAKEEISKIGKEILTSHFSLPTSPLICGFAGYGNVSQGAQEIFDLLGAKEIKPEDLLTSYFLLLTSHFIYKVVFKEEHMVELKSKIKNQKFDLQDYYDHPEKYCSKFYKWIPHLTMLINCIYWEPKYPRLVTKQYLRKLYQKKPRLWIIGDISCDIEGSMECTVHATEPDNPVFVYNPFDDTTTDGFKGTGPVVMAVDNLPCELSRESSIHFSDSLMPFVPEIVKADFSVNFSQCKLQPAIKNAVIVYQGELTPNYKHLKKFL